MILLLHISVHLTVLKFAMGVHGKVSTCLLSKIRYIVKRRTLTAITYNSGFILTQALYILEFGTLFNVTVWVDTRYIPPSGFRSASV